MLFNIIYYIIIERKPPYMFKTTLLLQKAKDVSYVWMLRIVAWIMLTVGNGPLNQPSTIFQSFVLLVFLFTPNQSFIQLHLVILLKHLAWAQLSNHIYLTTSG
ncbi:hypothetical protein ACJX0J_010214, partial [Zea mays]